MSDATPHDESFYRKLVENSSDLIAVVNSAGTLEYISPQVERSLGYAPEAVIGRPAVDFLHPDDIAPAREAIAAELSSTGTLWYLEVRIRAAEGMWIPLEAKGRLDRSSAEPRLIIHARDLRERLRIEAELRAQSSWARTLVEASPIALITLDAASNVTSWNPAAERLFGWSAAEVIGGPLPIMPLESPDEGEWLAEVIQGGKRFDAFDTRRRRRDGRLVDVTIALAPLKDEDGTVRGAIKLITDVSTQKTLERQFRQAERLDATGRLAGGIAHDFNNLLGTIIASAALLKDELPQGTPLAEDAAAILEAARRASELTRQLLTLGRRKSPKSRRMDLAAFVSAFESDVRRLAPTSVRVQLRSDRNIRHVMADPEQLREVLLRVFTNAVEAMPAGGALTIETRAVTLQGDDAVAAQMHADSYAMIAISDTGVGMTPDVLGRCLEPFFTTKLRQRNPGLGLATAFAIARQLGGGLSAVSEEGIGTTVRVYLPVVSDGHTVRATPVRGIAVAAREETVLLVEDDATFRALVRRALAQQGYSVLDAASGAEALSVFEQHPGKIDLLVADLVMPGIGGRELARRLRTLLPGLRVLYMSGYTSDVLRESGGLESSEAFIQKPFSPADFVGAVRGLFDVLA